MEGATEGIDPRSALTVGLAVVAGILLIFGYTSGWSTWTVGAGTIAGGEDFKISWQIGEVGFSGGGQAESEAYGPDQQAVEGMFDWTFAILIAATVALLAGVGLTLAGLLGANVPYATPRNIAIVFAVAGLIALAAPIQVMFGFPGAIQEDSDGDFSDSDENPGTEFWGENAGFSWGAGWAWYATLISGLISFGAATPAWLTHQGRAVGPAHRGVRAVGSGQAGRPAPGPQAQPEPLEAAGPGQEPEPEGVAPSPPEPDPGPSRRPSFEGEAPKPRAWAMLLPALTLVFVIAATFGTWHTWEETDFDEAGNTTQTFKFGISGMIVQGEGDQEIQSQYTSDGDGSTTLGVNLENIESTFDWTLVLLVLTILFAAGATALFILRAFELGVLDLHPGVPRVVALLAALLAVATATQVLVGFPGAVDADGFAATLPCEDVDDTPADTFWGTCSGPDGEASYGAGWAWWVVLAATVPSTVAAAAPWVGGPRDHDDAGRSVHMASTEDDESLVLEVEADDDTR